MLLLVLTQKSCGLRAAICVLRPVACAVACAAACAAAYAGRSTQIAASRPHSFPCVRTRNRIYVHTHAASKWNCWKFRCAMWKYRKSWNMFNSVRPAARGLRQSMNRPWVWNVWELDQEYWKYIPRSDNFKQLDQAINSDVARVQVVLNVRSWDSRFCLPPIFLTFVAFCRLFDVPEQNDLIIVSDRIFDLQFLEEFKIKKILKINQKPQIF